MLGFVDGCDKSSMVPPVCPLQRQRVFFGKVTRSVKPPLLCIFVRKSKPCCVLAKMFDWTVWKMYSSSRLAYIPGETDSSKTFVTGLWLSAAAAITA